VTGYIVDDVPEAVDAATRLDTLSRTAIRAAFVRSFTSRAMAQHYVNIYPALARTARPPALRQVVAGCTEANACGVLNIVMVREVPRLPSVDEKHDVRRGRKPDIGIRTDDASLDRDPLPQTRQQKQTIQYACLAKHDIGHDLVVAGRGSRTVVRPAKAGVFSRG
jgi:hypothetical protein